jgi:2-iminobutanoate/2-iminopropanoate deaminase
MGPYSSAVKCGDRIYLSGQAAFDRDGKLVGSDIRAQARKTLSNIKGILECNGYSTDNIASCTVYLSDISLWGAFNEAYGEFFTEPYPARTCVACGLNGFLVEIDCIAEA